MPDTPLDNAAARLETQANAGGELPAMKERRIKAYLPMGRAGHRES